MSSLVKIQRKKMKKKAKKKMQSLWLSYARYLGRKERGKRDAFLHAFLSPFSVAEIKRFSLLSEKS